MSSGLDLSQFYDTFFDEADELLAEMERYLLELDIDEPDIDKLNAIFRAAHSIKGGAATFGTFKHLADTTHLLENLLDFIRDGEMGLSQKLIDLFLETKDILSDQVLAYRNEADPDDETFERICSQLSAITDAHIKGDDPLSVTEEVVAAPPSEQMAEQSETHSATEATPEDTSASRTQTLCVSVTDISESEMVALRNELQLMGGVTREDVVGESYCFWVETNVPIDAIDAVSGFVVNQARLSVKEDKATDTLIDNKKNKANETAVITITFTQVSEADLAVLRHEMTLMGQLLDEKKEKNSTTLWLESDVPSEDISAVCQFVISADQIAIETNKAPSCSTTDTPESTLARAPSDSPPAAAKAEQKEVASPAKSIESAVKSTATESKKKAAKKTASASTNRSESTTLRVDVDKIDQIINLVGELVITQAMLVQTASELDPVDHDRLLGGIEQLERNARDLQESVMSIRMMPMDYVFSRFPRVVRENAALLNKEIRLETKGAATELDKSLIERIIDPLTHLVRNSIDHGIEMPDKREALGKPREGILTLSAQHQGGHIVIEIKDDGGGLNRQKVLKKAMENGLTTNENIPDEELWQMIFAPGFSTAEKVTAISGRGVGMDVVRRNIQAMGGNVQMSSVEGEGTTTRIILPLTLAILDGMSVQVGNETFILPLSHVTESMQPTEEQMRNVTVDDHVMYVRGEYLPVISLGEIFNVDGYKEKLNETIAIVLQAEDSRFALIVDHLIGQHQVVVKNLEANYRKIPGISAATILGDGSVALIVDVFALQRLTRSSKRSVSAMLD